MKGNRANFKDGEVKSSNSLIMNNNINSVENSPLKLDQ